VSSRPAVDPVAEAPPFLGTWHVLYAIVLGNLVFWIGVMAVITLAFS
jgi:hypothetical protein